MCYNTKHGEKSRVTKQDRIVLKVPCDANSGWPIGKRFKCRHILTRGYTIGKINKKVKICIYLNGEIGPGYHSFPLCKKAKVIYAYIKVGVFVIPKGTVYYSNREYVVSEQIIFKGWLDKKAYKEKGVIQCVTN